MMKRMEMPMIRNISTPVKKAAAMAGGVMVAEQEAQRPPAALAVPGGDGITHKLVEAVVAQGRDGHGVLRFFSVSYQAVPRRHPDGRDRLDFNRRSLDSLKEGEQVVLLPVEDRAAQEGGEFL